MDTASVEEQLPPRAPRSTHELRWSGELLEIVPTEPLDAGHATTRSRSAATAADVAGVAARRAGPTRIPHGRLRRSRPRRSSRPTGSTAIAPISPIAVVFDRPIDPGIGRTAISSRSAPTWPGRSRWSALPGDPPDDDGAGRAAALHPIGSAAAEHDVRGRARRRASTTTAGDDAGRADDAGRSRPASPTARDLEPGSRSSPIGPGSRTCGS